MSQSDNSFFEKFEENECLLEETRLLQNEATKTLKLCVSVLANFDTEIQPQFFNLI